MKNKVQIRLYLYCPCCDKNLREESIWIEPQFSGRIGRLPNNMPCIDCWNNEMGFLGNAEEKVTTKTEKMLKEDEEDMHKGEDEEQEEETDEDLEDDEDEISEESYGIPMNTVEIRGEQEE